MLATSHPNGLLCKDDTEMSFWGRLSILPWLTLEGQLCAASIVFLFVFTQVCVQGNVDKGWSFADDITVYSQVQFISVDAEPLTAM